MSINKAITLKTCKIKMAQLKLLTLLYWTFVRKIILVSQLMAKTEGKEGIFKQNLELVLTLEYKAT